LVETDFLDLDAGVLQCLAGTLEVGLFDVQRRAGTADLHGWIVRIQIGYGIHQADSQYSQDQHVLPKRVFVEHESSRPLMTRGAMSAPSDGKLGTGSDGFQRALGQGGRDGLLLELQLDVVGNLYDHEVVGDLGDLAGDTA